MDTLDKPAGFTVLKQNETEADYWNQNAADENSDDDRTWHKVSLVSILPPEISNDNIFIHGSVTCVSSV
jgi:hypothetical protein